MEKPKRMTWDEITAAYPDQWVGLTDVDWKNEANVRSAVVKYTDKSRDELIGMQIKSDNLYSVYTTPNNLPPFIPTMWMVNEA